MLLLLLLFLLLLCLSNIIRTCGSSARLRNLRLRCSIRACTKSSSIIAQICIRARNCEERCRDAPSLVLLLLLLLLLRELCLCKCVRNCGVKRGGRGARGAGGGDVPEQRGPGVRRRPGVPVQGSARDTSGPATPAAALAGPYAPESGNAEERADEAKAGADGASAAACGPANAELALALALLEAEPEPRRCGGTKAPPGTDSLCCGAAACGTAPVAVVVAVTAEGLARAYASWRKRC